MQNHLKIGSNFDYLLIDKVREINDKHNGSIIDEVYGSTLNSSYLGSKEDIKKAKVLFW